VGHFPNALEALDQSQHTDPVSQSEHSVLFRRRGLIETGTKQNITDRQERCRNNREYVEKYCFFFFTLKQENLFYWSPNTKYLC